MSGIVGIVSQRNCKEDLFYGTDYQSHLGTEFGGIAIFDNFDNVLKRKIHNIRKAQFKSKFAEDTDFLAMKGNKGIGVISDKDPQPVMTKLKFGEFAICGAGYINNLEKLVNELLQENVVFSEISDGEVNQIELAAKLINQGKDLVEGIKYMFNQIKGSMSLILLCKEGIYAMRDKFGRTPLVLGEKEDSKIIASESCCFANLGFETTRFLGPGEIILITEKDIQQIKKPEEKLQFCTFFFIYFGFPASEYEGKNVQAFRERLGSIIARKDNVKADFVCGIPDSGTAYAYGYASEAKIPLRAPILKYTPGWGMRSYQPPEQNERDRIALMKQLIAKEVIKDKKVIITEDSIVRGTQLLPVLSKLWEVGAKEIHVRVACPPLMFPCPFLYSTRSSEELFARKILKKFGQEKNIEAYLDPGSTKYAEMIEEMRRELNVTSLVYSTMEDVIHALGLPKEKLCTYCWTGEDPSEMT